MQNHNVLNKSCFRQSLQKVERLTYLETFCAQFWYVNFWYYHLFLIPRVLLFLMVWVLVARPAVRSLHHLRPGPFLGGSCSSQCSYVVLDYIANKDSKRSRRNLYLLMILLLQLTSTSLTMYKYLFIDCFMIILAWIPGYGLWHIYLQSQHRCPQVLKTILLLDLRSPMM